jgi:hypothetical protein
MKKDKKKPKTPKKEAPAKENRPTTQEVDDERPFDFGGLPSRDLKKNLGGCG